MWRRSRRWPRATQSGRRRSWEGDIGAKKDMAEKDTAEKDTAEKGTAEKDTAEKDTDAMIYASVTTIYK